MNDIVGFLASLRANSNAPLLFGNLALNGS
ncbi:IS110 family transposase, partial [Leptospira weilii serovar Heyan]